MDLLRCAQGKMDHPEPIQNSKIATQPPASCDPSNCHIIKLPNELLDRIGELAVEMTPDLYDRFRTHKLQARRGLGSPEAHQGDQEWTEYLPRYLHTFMRLARVNRRFHALFLPTFWRYTHFRGKVTEDIETGARNASWFPMHPLAWRDATLYSKPAPFRQVQFVRNLTLSARDLDILDALHFLPAHPRVTKSRQYGTGVGKPLGMVQNLVLFVELNEHIGRTHRDPPNNYSSGIMLLPNARSTRKAWARRLIHLPALQHVTGFRVHSSVNTWQLLLGPPGAPSSGNSTDLEVFMFDSQGEEPTVFDTGFPISEADKVMRLYDTEAYSVVQELIEARRAKP